jgi:uncharacterized protein (DUF427 family)
MPHRCESPLRLAGHANAFAVQPPYCWAMRARPVPIVPQPGQESVWDYPRPPRLEPVTSRVRVVLGGVTVADTVRAVRVLETSHPPNYYLPIDDVLAGSLVPAAGASLCEWKGVGRYFDVTDGGRVAARAAWAYPAPVDEYAVLARMVSFYPAAMDACFVGDEQVRAQAGGFYGGWITDNVVGPFKGDPGTQGW